MGAGGALTGGEGGSEVAVSCKGGSSSRSGELTVNLICSPEGAT